MTDVGWFLRFAESLILAPQAGDIVGAGPLKPLAYKQARLAEVPAISRMYATPRQDTLDKELTALGLPVGWVGYDLEGWEYTPVWERKHPVEAVKRAALTVHNHNANLMVIPSAYIADQNPDMALYADLMIPQLKGYQATMTLDQYEMKVRALYAKLRVKRPGLPIWHDSAMSPQGIIQTAQQIYDHYARAADLVQGAIVWYDAGEEQLVREFFGLLGR